GQYVDIAMSDGVTSLLAFPASQYFAAGLVPKPGVDMLNGGAPYYSVYETSDGRWLSIGCIEPWFWSELCKALDCEDYIPQQMNREKHPESSTTCGSASRRRPATNGSRSYDGAISASVRCTHSMKCSRTPTYRPAGWSRRSSIRSSGPSSRSASAPSSPTPRAPCARPLPSVGR